MPFKKDSGKRESEVYCSYCFHNGALVCPELNLKQFKKMCAANMLKQGMNKRLVQFYTFMIGFAPCWKNKK